LSILIGAQCQLFEMSTQSDRNKRPRNDASTRELCVSCQKDVEDDGVECEWCYKWEHRECAGLTNDEYLVLSNSNSKIMFFCSLCYSKVPFSLNMERKAASQQSALEQRLQSIEDKLKNLGSFCASLNDTSGSLESSSSMDSSSHQNQPRPVNNISTSEVLSSFINEEKERSKRRLNLIVHNVPEPSAESGLERKSEDINTVSSIFDKFLGAKVKVKNANRIGRRSDNQSRPRLIKVSVDSEQDKAVILRNCTKLRDKGNPEDIQKVYITPDLTPREQQGNKALRFRLAEMNKSEKKYWIKNGRIVQRGR